MKDLRSLAFVVALLGLIAAAVGGWIKAIQIVAVGVALVAVAVLLLA